MVNYGNYNPNLQQSSIVTHNSINQQNHFTDRLTTGDINHHVNRGNKGNGNNIQAVDMDVNEILKVHY